MHSYNKNIESKKFCQLAIVLPDVNKIKLHPSLISKDDNGNIQETINNELLPQFCKIQPYRLPFAFTLPLQSID